MRFNKKVGQGSHFSWKVVENDRSWGRPGILMEIDQVIEK